MERTLLVLPSAHCALAPGVSLKDGELCTSSGRRVRAIASTSKDLTHLLEHGCQFKDLEDCLREKGADADQARFDASQFLSNLDRHRFVSIRQSGQREALARVRLLSLWLLTVGMLGDPDALSHRLPTQRFAPTPRNLLKACLRAHATNFTLAFGASIATSYLTAYRSSLLEYSLSDVKVAIMLSAVLLGGLFGAAVCHEFGHFYVSGWTKTRLSGVYCRTGAAGVTLDSPSIVASRLIGASGAAAAITVVGFSLGLSYAVNVQPRYQSTLVLTQLVLILIIVLQAKDLLPFSEDGKLLWRRV